MRKVATVITALLTAAFFLITAGPSVLFAESQNSTCQEVDMDSTIRNLWYGIIDSERKEVDPSAVVVDYAQPVGIPTCTADVTDLTPILDQLKQQGFKCDEATGLMIKLYIGRRWLECSRTYRNENGRKIADCKYYAQIVSSVPLMVQIDRYYFAEPFEQDGNLLYTYLGSSYGFFPVPVKIEYTVQVDVKGIMEEYSPWLVFRKLDQGKQVKDRVWVSPWNRDERELVFVGMDPGYQCKEPVFSSGIANGDWTCPFTIGFAPFFKGDCFSGYSPRYGNNLYGIKIPGLKCYKLDGIMDADGHVYEAWKLGDIIPDPFNTGKLIDVTNDQVYGMPRSFYGELPPVEGLESVNFCETEGENPCMIEARSVVKNGSGVTAVYTTVWQKIPPGRTVELRQGGYGYGCPCVFTGEDGGIETGWCSNSEFNQYYCEINSCPSECSQYCDLGVPCEDCEAHVQQLYYLTWKKTRISNQLVCNNGMVTGGRILLYPASKGGLYYVPSGYSAYVCCVIEYWGNDVP